MISLLSGRVTAYQNTLIDASIAAGVKRFLPSEFGRDTRNDMSNKFPIFADKVKTLAYVQQKAEERKIEYTAIVNGLFLDWGLEVGFTANLKENGVTKLYDGGDVPFSATLLSAVGQAIVGVLHKPEQTKNRIPRVQSASVTQKKLLAMAQKLRPEREFKTEIVSTEDIERQSWESVKSGQGDIGAAMFGFLFRAVFGKGYGGQLRDLDNELLGVHALSEKEAEEIVARYL